MSAAICHVGALHMCVCVYIGTLYTVLRKLCEIRNQLPVTHYSVTAHSSRSQLCGSDILRLSVCACAKMSMFMGVGVCL